ncbi:hypothetical protein [Streptomyces sp. NBC_00102]|uniref:hypothetical protein n=1 Tax=Streptomyces sp. NBC_00102 TaxID=2975652 RepID=UPI00224DE456|nr:hypothetical protein [Streptomyces sp. NBC_00102]MCX5401053.1 hypothetical protein [Streptomyces sp. NBC_00102]
MTDNRPLVLACALLDSLDPLPYPARMRELADHARRLADDGELRQVLEELEDGEPYERGVAVLAAAAGGDREWVARHIADEDPFVRGQALRVADALGVPDAAFEEAMADAPAAVRLRLIRAVVAGRRTALADRLIVSLRDTWGDAEAARMLPGCSPEAVTALLPDLVHAVACWSSLGRRHPGPLLDRAARELAGLPEDLRDAWWRSHGHGRVVAAAAGRLPHRVLDLLEKYPPARLPAALQGSLGPLVTADPGRFIGLFLGPGRTEFPRSGVISATLLQRLARTAPEGRLVALGRALDDDSATLARLLHALPPGRRESFHASVTDRHPAGSTGIPVDSTVLDALPRDRVAATARRMAVWAREHGEPWDTVLLAESYLPAEEVRERLLTAVRRPAAEDRATAWSLLIRNAGRSGEPTTVHAVLDDMGRLRDEREPVRTAALRALLDTPPVLFTAASEPLLDRIATDAVEARDSSAATRAALGSLAVTVLREHAATGSRTLVSWSLRTLVRLTGSTGGADLGRLDRTLRRGQEHQVFEALRTWLEAGAERSDYGLVLAMARAAGRRAEGMAELQDLLRQAVRYGDVPTARAAITLYLEPLRQRDARVEEVLDRDRSALAIPAVWRVVARRRTDLLDGVLGGQVPSGRFATRASERTVPVGHETALWTPGQQKAALRGLERTADDEGLPQSSRAAAVARLAAVPGAGTAALRARAGSPDVVLAEAALAALARTDRPADALDELLAHAGGDRARVAVFAASRASRSVRPSRLAGVLAARTAPGTGKVTARKEMVRLAAARLPLERAAEVVADAYAEAGQHPDVRAACVAFAPGLLGAERIWEMLTDAAGSETAVLRGAVLRPAPTVLPERHRARFARLVQEVSTTGDPEQAAVAHRALARWLPWAPGASEVLLAAVTDLDRRGGWTAAADALTAVAAATPEAADALNRTFTMLATDDTADDAGAERDRPGRQRLVHMVRKLSGRYAPPTGAERALLVGAADRLAGHRDTVPQAAALLVRAIDPHAGADELHAGLVRLAALHEGRPALAARSARTLVGHLVNARQHGGGDPDVLLTVVGRLAASGADPAPGLFAVALTVAGGRSTEWTAPWRTQLRMLRQHPAADVRDAAYEEWTAPE